MLFVTNGHGSASDNGNRAGLTHESEDVLCSTNAQLSGPQGLAKK